MDPMRVHTDAVGGRADACSVQDIFSRLIEGVDEQIWRQHADVLRHRGFGVFDLRLSGSGDVEIISPDCLNWWQVCVGDDGCWRLQ